ncbi:MAG: hypothetical protein Q6373_003495 [Candidatus Sigynarchaeota archaeon]
MTRARAGAGKRSCSNAHGFCISPCTCGSGKKCKPGVMIVDVTAFDLLTAPWPLFLCILQTGPRDSKIAWSKEKMKVKCVEVKDAKDYAKKGPKIPILTPDKA